MLRSAALALLVVSAACSSNQNTSQSVASSSAQPAGSSPTMYPLGSISFGASLPPGKELTALQADCEICHGREMWASQRLSQTAWDAEVTKMIKFGAPVPKAEKAALVTYLARYLGPSVPRVGHAPTATAPPISFTGPPPGT